MNISIYNYMNILGNISIYLSIYKWDKKFDIPG